MGGNGLKLCQGSFRSDIRETNVFRSGDALVQAVQECGGVTVFGGVRETCGTEGHGLEGNIGGKWMIGLDDLGVLFQPQLPHSMRILRF